MTTSPLLPASTVCQPPPTSAMAMATIDGQMMMVGKQQQCRRCSFLFSGGGFNTVYNNLALMAKPSGGTEGKMTAVSNPSKFYQNKRRLSPPSLSSAFLNAAMMMNANGTTNGGSGDNTTSSSPFIRLLPFFAATECSGQHSRGENSLELEALTAVHQFAIAVQSIAVSEMLPRTPDLIFVNLTTLDGQPYCLELTVKGWRVTSLRTDCMQGDFTQMDTFTHYYDSLHDLMDVISPGYRERFAEDFGRRFGGLVERMQGEHQHEHVCCHSADCSSGQISDCEYSEETNEDFTTNNCAFCRKRLSREYNRNERHVENEEGTLSPNRFIHHSNSLLCPKE